MVGGDSTSGWTTGGGLEKTEVELTCGGRGRKEEGGEGRGGGDEGGGERERRLYIHCTTPFST